MFALSGIERSGSARIEAGAIDTLQPPPLELLAMKRVTALAEER